jgi:FkbM family methyltransferase
MLDSFRLCPTMGVIEKIARRTREETLRIAIAHKARGSGVIDYGWVKLPFSGDGDPQEVWYHNEQAVYRGDELERLRPIVPKGGNVVDAGANMGFMAALFAELVGPSGTVWAFEPSPTTFAKLERLIEWNDLGEVVKPCRWGCGSRTGRQTLFAVGRSSGEASMTPDAHGGEGVEVDVVALDDVRELMKAPVDVLKIDTEGFEDEVLAGAERILREDRPAVYIELCRDYRTSSLAALDLLESARYDVSDARAVDIGTLSNGTNFIVTPLPTS